MNKENYLKLSCCFTGHRALPAGERYEKLVRALNAEIEKLIVSGYELFIAGGAVGFDMLAAEAVIKFKEKYPFIRLRLVLPCKNYDMNWNDADKERQQKIISAADKTVYASKIHTYSTMEIRNMLMVDLSCCCIAYLELRRRRGGTFFTVGYAEYTGIKIINLATLIQ